MFFLSSLLEGDIAIHKGGLVDFVEEESGLVLPNYVLK